MAAAVVLVNSEQLGILRPVQAILAARSVRALSVSRVITEETNNDYHLSQHEYIDNKQSRLGCSISNPFGAVRAF